MKKFIIDLAITYILDELNKKDSKLLRWISSDPTRTQIEYIWQKIKSIEN